VVRVGALLARTIAFLVTITPLLLFSYHCYQLLARGGIDVTPLLLLPMRPYLCFPVCLSMVVAGALSGRICLAPMRVSGSNLLCHLHHESSFPLHQ